MLKRIIFFFIGIWILSLGVVFILKSSLGTGAWDTVFVGFYKKFGLTYGAWIFIVSFVLMFLNHYLTKEKIEWLSLPVVFVNSIAVDFWNIGILSNFHVQSLFLKVLFFVLGILLLAFGIVLYIKANFPKAPVDGFMLAIHKRFGIPVGYSRSAGELFAVIFGFLLGGPVGIGTFIITLIIGPSIQIFIKLLTFKTNTLSTNKN